MASNKSEEEKYLIHEEFQLRLSIKKKKLMVKVAEQKVHQLQLQLFNVEESFITEKEDYAQRCHQRKLVRRAKRHGMTLNPISITINIFGILKVLFLLLCSKKDAAISTTTTTSTTTSTTS